MSEMSGNGGRSVRSLVVLALAAGLAGCGTGESAESTALSMGVVERGNLRITAEATGSVEPVRQVEVKSKASGEVLKLHVDVGDQVERGTLLAEVDPRDVRNAYEQVAADLEVAQQRRAIAAAQLKRQEELAAAGFITEQELETARLDDANAEATLIRARTNQNLAELQLADVTIRAPLAGTILARNVEEGSVIQSASQNVSGGSVLFTMAELEQMQVRTLVDETDMGELRAGMEATVTVEAYPDRVFEGMVEKIEPQAVVQQNVTMFPVIVQLDNSSGLLKPGMNAEVEVLIDEATDVLLVPNNAIVNTNDAGPAAMVLGLDVENMDLTQFQRAGRFGGQMPAGAGGRGGIARGGTTESAGAAPNAGAPNGRGAAGGGFQPGDFSPDSARSLAAAMRGARGGGAGGRGGAGLAAAGNDAATRLTRRVVVFTVSDSIPGARPEPRLVEIGLNDWDRTQVLSGLEEGEQVALIGAAQLQAQQQEFMERIGNRGGGMPFVGGGGGGRGR
jgi:HlyD family secretion protein